MGQIGPYRAARRKGTGNFLRRVGAFPRCLRPRVGRSSDERPEVWFLCPGWSDSLSFMSYNPLVCKKRRNLKCVSSYLVALKYYDAFYQDI
jgi:hypothetical protein